MASAPMPVRLCARAERLTQHGAAVEAGPAHLHKIPSRPEILLPHLRIGLEAAPRENDDSVHVLESALLANTDSQGVIARHNEAVRGCVVLNAHASALDGLEKATHQAYSFGLGTHRAARGALIRGSRANRAWVDQLVSCQLEANAERPHPLHGRARSFDQERQQLLITSAAGGCGQV